jgi:hypothetical protein
MIKPRILVAGLAMLAMSSVALAGKHAKEDAIWPADAIKWEEGPLKGTHAAKLWGDWLKGGPFGVLIKFDAGLLTPLHHHTQGLKIVIVSGTLLYHPEGGTETKLGPGSYLFESKKHVSGCTAEADCVFFMTANDKFDMVNEEEAKAEKKK